MTCSMRFFLLCGEKVVYYRLHYKGTKSKSQVFCRRLYDSKEYLFIGRV